MYASGFEKRKTGAVVSELKAMRFGRCKECYVVDGFEDDTGNSKKRKEFWSYFGGKPDKIQQEDDIFTVPKIELSMHHISDSSGRMKIDEVGRGKLDKTKLDSKDVFLIDSGLSIFIWVGKGANKSEKRAAMKCFSKMLIFF